MNQQQLKQLFNETFKSKNIMTPDIISYGKRGNYAYELSTGSGFGGGTIYGITVINLETNEHDHELSGCYHSKKHVDLALKILSEGEKLCV